jgi:hypothetical protein
LREKLSGEWDEDWDSAVRVPPATYHEDVAVSDSRDPSAINVARSTYGGGFTPEGCVRDPDRSALAVVLQQNWENIRYNEGTRMAFTSVYSAITTATLAYLLQAPAEIDQRPLLIALDALSLFGLLVSIRLGFNALNYADKVFAAAANLGISEQFIGVRGARNWSRWMPITVLFPLLYVSSVGWFTWSAVLGHLP